MCRVATICILTLLSLRSFAEDLPPKAARSDPSATARVFLGHLHAGRVNEAFGMYAVNEKMPKPFLDDKRDDLERISGPAKDGTWHLTFVEIRVEGIAAVAVVNEDVKRGQESFDLDPLYLVRLEDQWWIVPGMTEPYPVSVLVAPKDVDAFKSLQQWFKKRKEELVKAKNGA